MTEAEAQATHVAVKLPQFWAKNPRTWFVQVEATFRRAKITQESTRFDYVLENLPPEVVDTIHAIVDDPGEDPYTRVKAKLLGTYSTSKHQAMWAIMDLPELQEDQKPSQLLDTMLAMLPTGVQPTENFFEALYLRKLPVNIRGAVMAAKFDSLEALAWQADIIWSSSERPAPTNAIRDRPHSPARHGSKQHKRAAKPRPHGQVCHFHKKFGNEARRCQAPCAFSAAGNGVAADDSD